jgi:hypothetical protein
MSSSTEGPPGAGAERVVTPEKIAEKVEEIIDHILYRIGNLPMSTDSSMGAETSIKNFRTGVSDILKEIGMGRGHSFSQGTYDGYTAADLSQLAAALRVRANGMLAEALPGVVERIRADAEENIRNLSAPF